jgi:hypothetical protein
MSYLRSRVDSVWLLSPVDQILYVSKARMKCGSLACLLDLISLHFSFSRRYKTPAKAWWQITAAKQHLSELCPLHQRASSKGEIGRPKYFHVTACPIECLCPVAYPALPKSTPPKPAAAWRHIEALLCSNNNLRTLSALRAWSSDPEIDTLT